MLQIGGTIAVRRFPGAISALRAERVAFERPALVWLGCSQRPHRRVRLSVGLFLIGVGLDTALAANAQTVPAQSVGGDQGASDAGDRAAQPTNASRDGDVVVTARRGAARMAPETDYNAAEIDALDAYDIGEVIQRTTDALGIDGQPVIIVNGQRVADPSVFLGFPPDALTRVEVLPREAGALYGGDPSRRVLNIILQPKFKSRDGLIDAKTPTAGGASSLVGDLRQGAISGSNTTQFGVNVARDSALFAGERPQYSQDHPGEESASLRPAGEAVAANLGVTRSLKSWAASLNFQAQARNDRSVALSGGEPVESRRSSYSLSVIGGLSGELWGWSLQATLTGQLSKISQSGLDASDSSQRSVAATLSASRKLLNLPAGPLTVNLSTQASRSGSTIESAGSRQSFPAYAVDLNGTIAIPLWRAPTHGQGSAFARALGDLSMALGANMREADAGHGNGRNAGLAWVLLRRVRLSGAWSSSTASVSDTQRFQPQYYGLPMSVFDFVTGKSAQVLPIFGGSPGLRPPRFDRISLSATAGPFTRLRLMGGVNLQRSNATDSIGSLSVVTPELEAAFPERFKRDSEGQLISIDQRPMNFASALTETLTSNLSASFPLGLAAPGAPQRVLQIALSHVWQLRNITVIRDSLPEMDLLSGDSGGLPRHQFNLQVDGRRGRWGVNGSVRWRAGHRIRRDSGRDGPDDLLAAAMTTIDLKLSYIVQRAIPRSSNGTASPRRGMGLQFGLEVENLLDSRPGARLGDGLAAPGYGRDDQDPVGRTVRLTIRRRF